MPEMSRMFLFSVSSLPRRSRLSSTPTAASRAAARVNAVPPSSSWEKNSATGRKLLDEREHLVPRLAVAEHSQRQVVLGVRRNKSFQRVGGAAQLGEAREAVLLERVVAVDQQAGDLAVVAEVILVQFREETSKNRATHDSYERLWICTDQGLDELDVVGALERRPQRERA